MEKKYFEKITGIFLKKKHLFFKDFLLIKFWNNCYNQNATFKFRPLFRRIS